MHGSETAFKFYDGRDISRSGEAVGYQRAIERNDEDDYRWIDGQGWEPLNPHP